MKTYQDLKKKVNSQNPAAEKRVHEIAPLENFWAGGGGREG